MLVVLFGTPVVVIHCDILCTLCIHKVMRMAPSPGRSFSTYVCRLRVHFAVPADMKFRASNHNLANSSTKAHHTLTKSSPILLLLQGDHCANVTVTVEGMTVIPEVAGFPSKFSSSQKVCWFKVSTQAKAKFDFDMCTSISCEYLQGRHQQELGS